MSSYFIQYDETKKIRKQPIRYISPIKIECSIKSEYLIELIIKFLESIQEINVYGYNAKYNEIWCKNIKKHTKNVHFTINILCKDNYHSIIILTPILANNLDIKNMLININKLIQLYDKNNFNFPKFLEY
jgi:hypothetical protein